MKRFSPVVFCFFLATCVTAADLPQILQKAKGQFRLGSFQDALATLDKLEAESQQPELERERMALTPVLAFYRGACLASLNRPAEAQQQFKAFLAFQPNASLDPSVYSKKVVAAFEVAKRSLSERRELPSETGSLAAAFRAFPKPSREEQISLGEDWTEGPVRFLMTPEEKRAFSRLMGSVARSEFVTAFWKARDPKPETIENEFRDEFEKRAAFADARFTQGETKGSLTDRGMVFILLGPPTYVGRKPLTSGEDTNDQAALFKYRTADVKIASAPGGTTSQHAARIDAVTGPGSKLNEAAANWREVWHYRRELLPRGIPYLQVDFEFVTKKGYGENVLQRDTQALDTLEKAKAHLRLAA